MLLRFTNLNQTGMTLMEVLIAVMVFSIGLLGLASLQVTGLKLGSDSSLRSIATMQAIDMADRMRTNNTSFVLGAASPYNNPAGNLVGNPNCVGKSAAGADVDVQCTSAQMAQHDFYEWYGHIRGQAASAWHPAYRQLLPAGEGVVCIDSTPDDGDPPPGNVACDGIIAVPNKPVFAIKLWWRERKDEQNPGPLQRFVTSLSP